jgi:hypothetical protein
MSSLQDIDHDVVANSNSKIYHDPNCYCVPLILEKHKVAIDIAHYDNKGRDYRPCSKCIMKNYIDKNNAEDLLEKGQEILGCHEKTLYREPLADAIRIEGEE